MKKNKGIYIKFLQSILFIMFFTVIILSNALYKSVILQEDLNKQNTNKGFIKLQDNYDGKNNRMGIIDFFDKSDSIKKMKTLYNDINNKNFKYYEILQQRLEFIGKYTGDSIFVSGSEQSINTKIEDMLITPLRSLQLGEKASIYLNIDDKINQGKYFSKKDYYLNSNNEVPVILGHLYSDMYKIGDSFQVLYLGCIKLKCNVIGFFKKDSSFQVNKEYKLDNKIVMPALNTESNTSSKNKKFEQVLYSIKNNGYIFYGSDREYDINTKIISDTVHKINIDWGYIGKVENPFKTNPIRLSIKTVTCIKFLSRIISLILIVIIYNLEKRLYKIVNISEDKRERVLFQTKKSVILALQMIILYISTCFIMSICLKDRSIYYTLIRIQRQIPMFLLGVFIVIIYMINRYIKKNIKVE